MSHLKEFFDTDGRIGKVVHQIWLSKDMNLDADVPEKFKANIELMKHTNPNYEHKFWKFRNVLQLFKDFPVLNRWKYFFFNTLKFHIEKCDFARYMIMLIQGGIYVDLDAIAKHSFDRIIEGRFISLVVDWIHCEKLSLNAFSNENSVFNGFLASAPGHKFWYNFMDYIMYNYKGSGLILDSTGPIALGRFMTIHKLYNEKKYLEIFIDRCLIIPTPVMHQQVRRGLLEPTCNAENSIIEIDFAIGMSWQKDASLNYFNYAVERNHSFIIFILVLIAIVLIVIWLGTKKRETILKQAIIEQKNGNI